MKRVLVAMMALVAVTSWGMTLDEARKKIPELYGLSDESALKVIHQVYYPHMDKADLAARLGVTQSDSKAPKPKLGPINLWYPSGDPLLSLTTAHAKRSSCRHKLLGGFKGRFKYEVQQR